MDQHAVDGERAVAVRGQFGKRGDGLVELFGRQKRLGQAEPRHGRVDRRAAPSRDVLDCLPGLETSEEAEASFNDISDHLRKIDSYTTLWARQAHGAGRRSNVVDVVAGATWAFFRNYVLKRGFLLGSAGLLVSVLNTHYTFVKLAKLRELVTGGDARR